MDWNYWYCYRTLLGGGLTWFNSRFQLRHQAEQDRKKFMLHKTEEIHQLLSQYKHSYKMITAEFLRTFASGQQEFGEVEPIPSERLKMLIGFYASDLTAHLNKIVEREETYGELVGNHALLAGKGDEKLRKRVLAFFCSSQGQ